MLLGTAGGALRAIVLTLTIALATTAHSVGAVHLGNTRGLILSNLPSSDSAAYRALKSAAGDPDGQALEMTGSEMWSVPEERIDALEKMAAGQGINVMEVDQKSATVWRPMTAAAPMTDKQSAMMHDAMASPAAMGIAVMDLSDPKIVEYALTKGMHAAGTPEAELAIALDAATTVRVIRSSVEKTHDGYVWNGHITGTDDPVTLLWWPSGRLSGQITYQGRHFVVKNLGGTVHGVVEMSTRKLPPEHAPMAPALMHEMHMKQDPLVTKGDASMLRKPQEKQIERPKEPLRNLEDAAPQKRSELSKDLALVTPPSRPENTAKKQVTIDLLVAYTPQAAKHYTDIDHDLIDLAVEEINQSFRNSGIDNVHVRLVHAYQTSYVENGTHFEHVFRFADKGDGYMDEVHGLRDQYKADVSALIVHDPNGCGLSAAVAPQADRAFTVVHHECAALSYSLAHEIGHIIGARHDMALDDANDPFPFGHGYVHGKDWRTMMSYEESCGGCPRLPIWSTPLVKVRGAPAGDGMSDNARVILEGAARVAAFR